MGELLYGQEVYRLVGAAMAVYNELGEGFREAVYQEALEWELSARAIPYVAQPTLQIFYKGSPLRKTYIPDFLAYDKIVVEIKALEQLTSREEAQLLNYLKATRCQLGLLVNFGAPESLQWKRMIWTKR